MSALKLPPKVRGATVNPSAAGKSRNVSLSLPTTALGPRLLYVFACILTLYKLNKLYERLSEKWMNLTPE
jgi:hypothetical protein